MRICLARGSWRPGVIAAIANIVRGAQGNPFLATQLTALASAKLSRGDSDPSLLSVEDLVLNTSSPLSEQALQLLKVLSVAGRLLLPRIALQASGITGDQRARAHDLQTLRLVRTRHVSGNKLLDTYHDRLRTSTDGDGAGLLSSPFRRARMARPPQDRGLVGDALRQQAISPGRSLVPIIMRCAQRTWVASVRRARRVCARLG